MSRLWHILPILVAAVLGWIVVQVEGFGCAVGDPPFVAERCWSFSETWIKSILFFLALFYLPYFSLWLFAKLKRAQRG